MSRDKQIDAIYEDLVEIFDEEYSRRNLITPQNTAERMTDKGYRKASDVALEVIEALEDKGLLNMEPWAIAELKKKYIERSENGKS